MMKRILSTGYGIPLFLTTTILWALVSLICMLPAYQLRNPPGMTLFFWNVAMYSNGIAILIYSALLILDQSKRVRCLALIFMIFCFLSIRQLEEVQRARRMQGLAMTVHSLLDFHKDSEAVHTIRNFR